MNPRMILPSESWVPACCGLQSGQVSRYLIRSLMVLLGNGKLDAGLAKANRRHRFSAESRCGKLYVLKHHGKFRALLVVINTPFL